MFSEPQIMRAVKHVKARFHCEGILCYGSYARASHAPGSDVDLICLYEDDRARTVVSDLGVCSLDAMVANRAHFERKFIEQPRRNNHWLLRAFATGKILEVDNAGHMSFLCSIAKELWSQGPSAPCSKEMRMMQIRSMKIASTAKRLRTNNALDISSRQLAELQCALYFDSLTRDYCSIHQLWSSSFKELKDMKGEEYAEISGIINNFLSASDVLGRCGIIQSLAELLDAAVSIRHVEHARVYSQNA